MAQTSLPERTRRLPNCDFHVSYVDLLAKTLTQLLGRSRLEEKFERLAQVFARLFDGPALARNVEFRAERYVAVGVALDDCR